MSDEPDTGHDPDALAERTPRRLVERALEMIRSSEAARLAAYREGGCLLREAKEAIGHGRWLLFIHQEFPGQYKTVNQVIFLAEGIAGDPWLAGEIERRPGAWSVEKAVEYLHAADELRAEMRERGVVTDLTGERRVPLAEAGHRNLRHHKRFAAGKSPRPDPVLVELAKGSRFIPPGTAREMVDRWVEAVDGLRARMNLSGEDPGPPEGLERLVLSLSALSEAALGFRTAVQGAKLVSEALRAERAE